MFDWVAAVASVDLKDVGTLGFVELVLYRLGNGTIMGCTNCVVVHIFEVMSNDGNCNGYKMSEGWPRSYGLFLSFPT